MGFSDFASLPGWSSFRPGRFSPRRNWARRLMSVSPFSFRLFSSDVRMLACRVDADPRRGGACAKERFAVAERSLWLCPKRVAIFSSAEGGSLADVRCDQPMLFEVLR